MVTNSAFWLSVLVSVSLPPRPVQDNNRIYDGDNVPNSGGTGCYAPGKTTPALLEKFDEIILRPTLDGLRQEGIPFIGILLAGIIVTPSSSTMTM